MSHKTVQVPNISCGHCVTVCPTGALVEKGMEEATTIPIPGFNQKNSVGKTIERTGETKGPMTPQKGDLPKADDEPEVDEGGEWP